MQRFNRIVPRRSLGFNRSCALLNNSRCGLSKCYDLVAHDDHRMSLYWELDNTIGNRYYSSTAVRGNKNKATTLRFYRILLRQCKDFRKLLTEKQKQQQQQHYDGELLEGDLDGVFEGSNTTAASSTSNKNSKDAMKFILQLPLDPRNSGSNRVISNKQMKEVSSAVSEEDREEYQLLDFFRYHYNQNNSNRNDDNKKNNDQKLLDTILNKYWKSYHPEKESEAGGENHDVFEPIEADYSSNYSLTNNNTWIDIKTVEKTLRQFFKKHSKHPKQEVDAVSLSLKSYQLLSEQMKMWENTSVSLCHDHGIRIVATSCYAGNSASIPSQNSKIVMMLMAQDGDDDDEGDARFINPIKYRFCYRIRIQNIAATANTTSSSSDKIIDCNDSNEMQQQQQQQQTAVQLLGRSWHIRELVPQEEEGEQKDSSSSNVKSLKPIGDPIIVDAPTSGAVGQLPVLQNGGDIFEYMSACELSTIHGDMKGSFYFAIVPHTTQSATLGTHIDAYTNPKTIKFSVPVQPFGLEAK